MVVPRAVNALFLVWLSPEVTRPFAKQSATFMFADDPSAPLQTLPLMASLDLLLYLHLHPEAE